MDSSSIKEENKKAEKPIDWSKITLPSIINTIKLLNAIQKNEFQERKAIHKEMIRCFDQQSTPEGICDCIEKAQKAIEKKIALYTIKITTKKTGSDAAEIYRLRRNLLGNYNLKLGKQLEEIKKQISAFKKDQKTEITAIADLKFEKNKKIKKLIPAFNFPAFFKEKAEYQSIMDLLVEKGFLKKGSLLWIDDKKGNKGLLVAILKELRSLGYFKTSDRLSAEKIQVIAKDDFGMTISIDTIKRVKTGQFDVSFIPSASALK